MILTASRHLCREGRRRNGQQLRHRLRGPGVVLGLLGQLPDRAGHDGRHRGADHDRQHSRPGQEARLCRGRRTVLGPCRHAGGAAQRDGSLALHRHGRTYRLSFLQEVTGGMQYLLQIGILLYYTWGRTNASCNGSPVGLGGSGCWFVSLRRSRRELDRALIHRICSNCFSRAKRGPRVCELRPRKVTLARAFCHSVLYMSHTYVESNQNACHSTREPKRCCESPNSNYHSISTAVSLPPTPPTAAACSYNGLPPTAAVPAFARPLATPAPAPEPRLLKMAMMPKQT